MPTYVLFAKAVFLITLNLYQVHALPRTTCNFQYPLSSFLGTGVAVMPTSVINAVKV